MTEGSFAAFYDREWRQVVGLGFVLTGSRAQAEDLAQDAFIAAFRDWHRVAGLDSPGGWVRRAVVNRSSSWFRRLSAERRALRRLGDPQPPLLDLDLDAQAAEVWAEVRSLPRRQRQVVALVYFDGMSTAEAADVMGCGVETARTHLKRGRTALARRLGVWEGPDA